MQFFCNPLYAFILLLAAISACSPDNVTPQDNPAKETWTLAGWNDTIFLEDGKFVGETVRLTYNPDSSIQSYIEDTLHAVIDELPIYRFRFIRENGRITRVRNYSSRTNQDYESAVLHYNGEGRLTEIEDYQLGNTQTSLLWTRKLEYNAAGKLAKIDTWRNGDLWSTRVFEWSGDDMIKTKFGYPTPLDGESTYTYDNNPSPETSALGVTLQYLMLTNEDYELMSRHRLVKLRDITYTYTYTENGLPEFRFERWPGSGGYPDRITKRAYVYIKH